MTTLGEERARIFAMLGLPVPVDAPDLCLECGAYWDCGHDKTYDTGVRGRRLDDDGEPVSLTDFSPSGLTPPDPEAWRRFLEGMGRWP